DALKAALIETRAKLAGAHALIEHLQLVIAKMKREMFGPRSERSQRLIDQLELQLEELAAAAGEDETKAETARAHVQGFTRRLAMMVVDKYANHQPLNRQSEQFAREGIELSVSTMADHVGACAAALMPLYELIKSHVFAAERIHGDDTTVPVLAKVKTRTGRI